MKKLNKKFHVNENSIEAYGCNCSCSCGCTNEDTSAAISGSSSAVDSSIIVNEALGAQAYQSPIDCGA